MTKKYKGELADMYQASFMHTYSVGSFMPGAKGRHDCLRRGYWCWLNLKEYPLDIIKYIKNKL